MISDEKFAVYPAFTAMRVIYCKFFDNNMAENLRRKQKMYKIYM